MTELPGVGDAARKARQASCEGSQSPGSGSLQDVKGNGNQSPGSVDLGVRKSLSDGSRLPSVAASSRSSDVRPPQTPRTPGPRGRRPVGHLRLSMVEDVQAAKDGCHLPNLSPSKDKSAVDFSKEQLKENLDAEADLQASAGPNRTLYKVARMHIAMSRIEQCWRHTQQLTSRAKRRIINSEAARRLRSRESFQARADLRKERSLPLQEQPSTPTVWQLQQCPLVLRDAFHDTTAAARLVESADVALRHTHAVVQRRKKVGNLFRKQLPKISAISAFNSMLGHLREAEQSWVSLVDSVKTPKGKWLW